MKLYKVRGGLYKAARTLGDIEAILKGPIALIKRLVRRKFYKWINRWTKRILP
jgi:hypothetical protein